MSRRARSLLRCLVCGLLLAAPALAQPPSVERERPRIGLALGGGSARGLAHVGVLEWLEEHRVTVDAIAGTSIGGLVGGAYATGRSAAEVRALVEAIDWDAMFRGEVAYASRSYRRKEDRRQYPVRLELGLRDGLRLAPSLDPGHEVELFLSRLALPYPSTLGFDELPTPFRAVATDLETAASVALSDGALASALRATMAIPGIFQPVVRDGRLLADGGLLNNVPADVVRRMGTDVVVAVDVSAPLDGRDALDSLVGVANQAIGVMMVERTRAVLERDADHVLRPGLDDVGADGWRRVDELRARGWAAAEASADVLLPFALPAEAWEEHLAGRAVRRITSQPAPAVVRVTGVDEPAADDIAVRLAGVLDPSFDLDRLETRLSEVAGDGRYASLGYDLLGDEADTLGIRVRDKPHGPPFVNLALTLENRADDVEFEVGGRLTAYDVGGQDAELRLDLGLGSDLRFGTEYRRPLGAGWFVAPRLQLRSRTERFTVDGDPIASFRTQRAVAGGDLGVTIGSVSELRVGYEVGVVDAQVRVGAPVLPGVQGREQVVRLDWVYDGHDDWVVPRRGGRIDVAVWHMFEGPAEADGLTQATLRASVFVPAGPGGRLFVALDGASSFDRTPSPFYQFTLGGPFRLGAFDPDEFRGSHRGYLGAGYLHQVGRLPDLVGGPVHVGGWFETGSAFDQLGSAHLRSDVAGGILIDTLLGALVLSGSVGQGGDSAFYVALGRPFW